ncbi:hypothetical protein ACHAQA_009305 [Verticillium albo-atrum]
MAILALLLFSLSVLGVRAKECSQVFNLTLTWEPYSANGNEREMILVNGQFPAPTIELNEGQQVEVNVHNNLPFDTSVHFHGIEMLHTPWSDGTPGLTQRPIKSGSSFSYKWTATQHGSHWYHAHLRAQIEDGLYGAILIHPRKHRQSPFSLISSDPAAIHAMGKAEKATKPVILSDLRHMPSQEVWDVAVKADMELTCYDSLLVNGKGGVQCRNPEEIKSLQSPEQNMFLDLFGGEMTDKGCLPAEIIAAIGGAGNPSLVPPEVYTGCTPTEGETEVIEFKRSKCDKEKWVSLDIIGAFGFFTAMVSIVAHPLWVYAVDGDYVIPQQVHAIPVTNGDRYSVLLKADQLGDFTIRVASVAAPQIITGRATLSIREKGATSPPPTEAPPPYILDNGAPASPDTTIFNQALAKPYPPSPIPVKADAFYKLDMRTAGSSLYWALNNTALLPSDHEIDTPLLFAPDPHRFDNVTITTLAGTWVDLVFVTAVFPMPPHPLHKHGNKMYQIGAGTGPWTWASVEDAAAAVPDAFNFVDPPRRDAFASPPAIEGPAWLAVRYRVDNPGPWLLHCHIQNHMSGGMSVIIQDGIDEWPEVPEEYRT